jgi:hypothetical protein
VGDGSITGSTWRSAGAGLAAALAIAGGVAACSGATTSPTYQSPDSRVFAQSAMASGPMLVRIQGSPYTAPEPRLADAVLTQMRSAMSWTGTPRLTTAAGEAPTSSLLVILTFNAGVVDANVQCSGGSAGGPPQPDGAVRIAASFCGSGSLISNTSGRIERSTGPDDPAFAHLVRQVTNDLFPSSTQPPPGLGIQIGGGRVGVGSGVGVGIGF